MNQPLVSLHDGKDAASKRLRSKGWSPMTIGVSGASFAAYAKDSAVVAFHPTDDYATVPLIWGGFAILGPAPQPLLDEGIDALCDSAAGGRLDFTKSKGASK